MEITKILWQNRRDFEAIYHCEHCGFTKESDGYDDENFHKNVIPKMKCDKCGESSKSDYKPLPTKYPDGMQV